MGQGDQICEHQAGVIWPADIPLFPFRELNLSQCGNWRSQNVATGHSQHFALQQTSHDAIIMSLFDQLIGAHQERLGDR